MIHRATGGALARATPLQGPGHACAIAANPLLSPTRQILPTPSACLRKDPWQD